MGSEDLLFTVDVDVDAGVGVVLTGVETVLAAVVETLFAAVFEAAVFETGVATVGLVDTDVLFLAHVGSWATAIVLGDADVLTEVLFVTGRGGFLGSWWLLTFPSSALDRDVLFSLDLFGLLVVLVG